uniref:DNA-(apurinic or apyrimidinic site) endonuclease 2 n=1 Tax=Thielaviopsis musarum TaxID=1580842 RepID=A0A2R4ZP55_9PEZI|nr:TPA_exp: AP endonuclease protein 2 [Thielaviopsis musarum]
MGFRITTWNGENPFAYHPWRDNRSYEAMFSILQADIVVLQECKIQRKDLTDEIVLVPGWDVYFSLPLHKKGYAGVAVYTRSTRCAPIRAEEGITGMLPSASGCAYRDLPASDAVGGYPTRAQLDAVDVDEAALDAEGRCVVLEFPAFVLLGVYAPAQRDETRTAFRAAFFAVLDIRVRNLVALGKHVVVAGDLNVSRDLRDSCGMAGALAKEGVSAEAYMASGVRRMFNQQVFNGMVVGPREAPPVLWDLCREAFVDRDGMYTCWDTKRNTRPANNGSRIDYVLCSSGVKDWVAAADIQPGLMGSDHCPVYAELHDRVQWRGAECAVEEAVNPPGRVDGTTGAVRAWTLKDALGLSGRLIPEFAGRRNIRDMFMRAGRPEARVEIVAKTETGNAAKTETRIVGSNKRPASTAIEAPARAAKKARPLPAMKNARVDAKQSKLSGFFAPKRPEPPSSQLSSQLTSSQPTSSQLTSSQPTSSSSRASPKAAVTVTPERVFDPIEAKESWNGLLGKRSVPLCEHAEPCTSLRTKKPGVNYGRSFFMCARPLGPSGDKEKDSEWRCGTFIWSTDWRKT